MSDWKIVPVEPTVEMLNAGRHACAGEYYKAMLAAAPLPPHEALTAEEARSGQHWHGMDGACAFHLIERHAQGWGETANMMQAWLDANKGTR